MRVIVAMTGASGAPYGVRMLRILRELPDVETHLVVSRAAALTIAQECDERTARDVEQLADVVHKPSAIGATIASGSYPVDAMLVVPCSIRTLSAIAYCHANDLIVRAADVCLKEGRPLVLMVRETPLHLGHLRAMSAAAESGAVIMPPVPACYALPKTVDDVIDHSVRRALVRAGVTAAAPRAWDGQIG
ncbi:UbiX family flavin prenyltransferase [Saccharopolyspora sp. K220]|uniref:UbiX family flavin prenyltransferase n=1 Tax=Saccharopolyspora soli TaxID=2926618 RepID=UPI001F575B1D|nr:UbiX family flavin prenyltransferase [Saccharopolyspora soli]MCI2422246.1 UbiX family flavin prenyltransferase [Saccharopolyspora soli]